MSGLNPDAPEFVPKGPDTNKLGPTYSLASMPWKEALPNAVAQAKVNLLAVKGMKNIDQAKALSGIRKSLNDFRAEPGVAKVLEYIDDTSNRPPEGVPEIISEVISMLDRIKGGRRGKKTRKSRRRSKAKSTRRRR